MSLRRLLESLKENAYCITEETLIRHRGSMRGPEIEGLDRSAIEKDLIKDMHLLTKYGRGVHAFTDKYLAHNDKDARKIDLPTWGEIKEAIRRFHYVYRKWALIIAGMNCQLDDPNPLSLLPSDGEDYEEQFTRMWLSLRDDPAGSQ